MHIPRNCYTVHLYIQRSQWPHMGVREINKGHIISKDNLIKYANRTVLIISKKEPTKCISAQNRVPTCIKKRDLRSKTLHVSTPFITI